MSEADNSGDECIMVGVTQIKQEPDVVEIGDDDDISELEHLRKIFVGGLVPYTTEASLRTYFERFGKVVDVVVMRDPVTKRSRGFGFVTYLKSASVNKAQANRPHVVDGKTVESKRALQRVERDKVESSNSVKKLFVGGLKEGHDENNLKEYFSKFGNVVSVKLLTDRATGKKRGFAFVEYDDYDAVDKAILQVNHTVNNIAVDVKKSVYSQELKTRQMRQLQNGLANGIPMNNMANPGRMIPTPAPMARGYQMPKQPMQPMQPMPYQAPPVAAPVNGMPQGPPVNGGMPQGPPPPANFNYWGPPPQMQAPPYGYQQPPPMAPMQWNGPPAPANWNGYPQQGPPAPVNWQPNQWGYGPPPNAAPPAPWVAPPQGPPMQQQQMPQQQQQPPQQQQQMPQQQQQMPQQQQMQQQQQVAPPGVPGATPENPSMAPVAQQQQQPPQGPPPNFGTGYQQNYGGGPMKHNNSNQMRPNPYTTPAMNPFANGNVAGPDYGLKPMVTAATVPPVGGGYRR